MQKKIQFLINNKVIYKKERMKFLMILITKDLKKCEYPRDSFSPSS